MKYFSSLLMSLIAYPVRFKEQRENLFSSFFTSLNVLYVNYCATYLTDIEILRLGNLKCEEIFFNRTILKEVMLIHKRKTQVI